MTKPHASRSDQPKRKSEKRQRDAMFSIRLLPDELIDLQAAASGRGLSVSAFIRDSALMAARSQTFTRKSDGSLATLIERGSLGTPEAKALRATVSDEDAAKVVARAAELAADPDSPAPWERKPRPVAARATPAQVEAARAIAVRIESRRWLIADVDLPDHYARQIADAVVAAGDAPAVADAEIEAAAADLRAEVERLRRWKAEAMPLISDLQDLGKALGVRLGEQITGKSGAEAAKRLSVRAEAAERALADERAKVARVEALHHLTTVPATVGLCAAEECDHEDECPTEAVAACAACWSFANDVDSYYGENGIGDVLWPCATIAALAGPTPEATEGGDDRG